MGKDLLKHLFNNYTLKILYNNVHRTNDPKKLKQSQGLYL
jgi:hypothetical protein